MGGLVHYLTFGQKGQNLARMNELANALRQGERCRGEVRGDREEPSPRRSAESRFGPAHALLAQALARLERPAEALPFAQQSVTLAPVDSFSHESLGRVYWSLGKREEAIASVKRALGYADRDATRSALQQLLEFFTRARSSSYYD